MSEEYSRRLKAVGAMIKRHAVDALLIEEPCDLYYLTGLTLSLGKILVDKKGKAHLFVDPRYYNLCRAKSPLAVEKLESFFDCAKKSVGKGARLGFESKRTTYASYAKLKKELQGRTLVPLNETMAVVRSIKDEEEIEKLRAAAELTVGGFEYVQSILDEGITEKEVARQLEIFLLQNGAEAMAFETIVAFGKNSAYPHYRPEDVPLVDNSPILIDFGIVLNHYRSDTTRMLFFGDVDPELQRVYTVVCNALLKAVEIARPGVSNKMLDKEVRDYIAAEGYGDAFLHSLGHGIGIETHEMPHISSSPHAEEVTLEQGMVFTIEPGIYLSDKGGVRLENTVVIDEEGCEDITGIPLLRFKGGG
ncbi:aminopeptidase P family protein [Simkania negevensis]|uniref:Aminopeptidase P family protein n=1 Tax=Simkania negevensis TaxID=83561 RepID=A0ABS3ATY6_9BACT|nr:aminopeptidase P family protein [Simkania negevensis]